MLIMKVMKRIIFLASLSVVLTACSGGGGGGSGGGVTGNTAPVQQAPVQLAAVQQLGTYLGTWGADCSNHELEYVTITRVSDDTIRIASKVDYYAGEDCTGAIVGTQADTGDVIETFAGAADASVILPPATTPSTIKVDRVNATVPDYSVVVTGSGVTRATVDGKPQWCVNFDAETATCIQDQGVHPGSTSSGAIAIQGNQLLILSADGSGFTLDQRMTKK